MKTLLFLHSLRLYLVKFGLLFYIKDRNSEWVSIVQYLSFLLAMLAAIAGHFVTKTTRNKTTRNQKKTTRNMTILVTSCPVNS